MLNQLWLNLAGWMERVIVTRLVRKRVGPLMRLVFKTPILFYRLGLGGLVGKHILLLFTTGRRTGKTRITPLEYSYDPRTGAYFLMSGWEGRSDWYRNARSQPQVRLWVGKQRIQGQAKAASAEEVVREMENVMRAYPKAAKTWSGHTGIPYDGTRESLLRMAAAFPSLYIVPETPSERTLTK